MTMLTTNRSVPTITRGLAVCRVCGSPDIVWLGAPEYLTGYSWDVWECSACGCCFTKHDAAIYDILHETGGISYYSDYKSFAKECQSYFAHGDINALERLLIGVSKYKFIIQQAAQEPQSARLLEIGSSRGYLTSYFIQKGRNILGVDVSSEAVENARALYGDHFAIVGDPRIKAQGPYDLVYHVGLIGCVADPIGMTRDFMSMLRPGGRLLFNAPNSAARHLVGQAWLDSAPPPDLVTLFPPGFWNRQFAEIAEITERVETVSPDRALVIGLQQLFRLGWHKPEPKNIHDSGGTGHVWGQYFGPTWRLFERVCNKAGRLSGLSRLAPGRPTDFGLFITMTRK